MKLGLVAAPTAALVLAAAMAAASPGQRILVNHVGYDVRGSKRVIVQSPTAAGFDAFQVIGADGLVVLERPLEKATAVDRWKQGFFFRGTFSDLREPGLYRIVAKGPEGKVTSEPFAVAPKLLAEASISDLLSYLKSQRSSGVFDQADRHIPFFGESRAPVDVHGGWFDASGDTSKYLSHLSYANFMNYLAAARSRRASLVARLHRDEAFSGFWRADTTGDRPFFHAVDAGLPVVALLRYVAVEPEAPFREEATKTVLASLRFELAITREVANPFGYARQYVKDLGKGKRSAFFFPHQNESGIWWQGESARLASLAAAAFLGGRHAPPELRRELDAYAVDQLDWPSA